MPRPPHPGAPGRPRENREPLRAAPSRRPAPQPREAPDTGSVSTSRVNRASIAAPVNPGRGAPTSHQERYRKARTPMPGSLASRKGSNYPPPSQSDAAEKSDAIGLRCSQTPRTGLKVPPKRGPRCDRSLHEEGVSPPSAVHLGRHFGGCSVSADAAGCRSLRTRWGAEQRRPLLRDVYRPVPTAFLQSVSCLKRLVPG